MKWLTHEQDKIGDFQKRVLIHLPIGFIIGVLFPLTYPVLKIFIRYEENEDVHTKDQAWKDYAGAMVGCVIGNFVEAGIIIWLLLRWLL